MSSFTCSTAQVQTLCIADAAAALAVAVAAALESEAADKKVCAEISAKADFPLTATAAVALVIISPPCVEEDGSFFTEQEDPVTIEIVGIPPVSLLFSCLSMFGTCPGTVRVLPVGFTGFD